MMQKEVPALVARGIRSLKVFLTYDPLRLTDAEFLEVLAAAKRLGAFVTVHCENFDAIGWRIQALLKAGLTDPLQHAWSRPRGGARGDAPRHRAGRAGGPADPGLPRLLRGGGGRDRPREGPRPEGVGRDLPAILHPRP
ncbi:hypothetical protein [Teichococcus aestuarii]|uniref:hypothetical protein n=1 Tax=Teichococcus aestuarii TaxID=568898 RepID=UPI0036227B66